MNTTFAVPSARQEPATPMELEGRRTAQLRPLVRRCAGIAETDGLDQPGPIDLFVLSHQPVQDLVARTFPDFSSLVHVSQDIEVLQAPTAGDGYTATTHFASARSSGTDADLVVACTVSRLGRPVAVLRAQIRLGGVSAEAVRALKTYDGDAAAERPRAVRDGETRTSELSFDHASVAAYAELSGDHNPIHLDDQAGRAAGFDGAIVHGMAVVAASFEAALSGFAQEDIRRVVRLSARFSAATPVGAISTCELAGASDGTAVSFKVTGPNGTSVKNGHVGFAAAP
jgi:hypothetical protein